MPIKLLPEDVSSQIAAGEVIERPSSVVKELIENAIDAQSNQIDISIEAAGKRRIEVADNGYGISPQEIELALARYATSKIDTSDDLYNIRTLGFRGEALASITSVSKLTLTSQVQDATHGIQLHSEAGQIKRIQRVGASRGTIVLVEDLFYNIPARLKFLKSDSTEKQQIINLVTRYGLAYPDIRFHLIQEGKPIFITSGSGDRREIIAGLFSVDIAQQLLEVTHNEENIKIVGFISPLHITRSNRKEITFFINGRWVHDVPLTTAVVQAYKNMIMVGRYPLSILFIDMDPSKIDVNVHPTKAEVRFTNPDFMFSTVQRVVRRGLLSYGNVPEVNPYAWSMQTDSRPGVVIKPADNQTHTVGDSNLQQSEDLLGSQDSVINQPVFPAVNNIPILRPIGQIGSTYIVAEGPDGLYLVDQHAAHERVLFEKMLMTKDKDHVVQPLLGGQLVHLSPQSAQLINDKLVFLESLGFQIEPFGLNTIMVRTVPAVLGDVDPALAINGAIEDLEMGNNPLDSKIEEMMIAGICKRIAIKGGQVLSDVEQKSLIRDLEACQSPRTCPHGRPTMIHLSVNLLERQFGRRGSR